MSWTALFIGRIERQEGLRVGAGGLGDVVVQIAVAHVAEADDARARARPPATAGAARAMNSGTDATGIEMSCLIDAPSGFCASEMSSRSCQKARPCARLAAITASPASPASSAFGEDRLDQAAGVLGASGRTKSPSARATASRRPAAPATAG